jgi:hypothetical protein
LDRQKQSKPRSAPAEGERKLRIGIGAQDQEAAMLILRGLRDGRLEWVRVGDPRAGKLDDFQIATTGRVDAYQVKYSDSSDGLGFTWFAGMLPELTESWEELSAENPDRFVVAHLFTTQRASTRDVVKPVGEPPPRPRHFAAFIEQVLRPIAGGGLLECAAIPECWRPTWDSLAQAVTMDGEELLTFARNLRVEMGQTIPDGQPVDPRLDPTLESDLDAIRKLIDRSVRRGEVTLSRRQLLARLGWQHRTELRSDHDFPIDPSTYRRNERSSAALAAVLGRLTGGYVALVGPPGSGKSSLLTDIMRRHPGVVARYYAHIPEETEIRPTRARAVSFLHDLTLGIERAGVVRSETFNSDDPDLLAVRLERQLKALGELARHRGAPSVILIDGLDHVDRALPTGASESLLRYLPANVPDGVLIVLGSQTLHPAPEHVRTELARDGRTIEIAPLERATVLEIARAAGIRDDKRREQIWLRSAGHPLHALYIAEQMVAAAAEGREWEGEDVPGGAIDELYRRCWSGVEDSSQLVELFGLIARWEGPIDLELFADSYGEAVVELRRVAGHFFRKEADDRWLFFHSSFRDFLIAKTGGADGRAGQRYHRKLAKLCATLPSEDPSSWAQLAHLLLAREDEQAMELATPELFRDQVGAFRAPYVIARDIRAALDATVRRRDLVGIAKLVIAQDEVFRHRLALTDSYGGQRLPVLLVRLGRVRQALAYLGNETELRTNAGLACEVSVALDIAGERLEAEHLFALAELRALRGVGEREDNRGKDPGHALGEDEDDFEGDGFEEDVFEEDGFEEDDFEGDDFEGDGFEEDVFEEDLERDREGLGYDRRSLIAWATAAPRFRTCAEILEQVLGVTGPSPGSTGDEAQAMLRADLLLEAGRSLVELDDLAGVAQVSATFDMADEHARSQRLLLDIDASRHPDIEVESRRLLELLDDRDPAQYRVGARVLAAEGLLLVGRSDAARAWVDSLPPPSPAQRHMSNDLGEDRLGLTLRLGREDRRRGAEDRAYGRWLLSFKLNRLLEATSSPQTRSEEEGGSSVAAVARLLGRMDAGQPISAHEFGELIDRLAGQFNRYGQWREDGTLSALLGVLVWIAARLGPDARACVLAKLSDDSVLPRAQRWQLLVMMARYDIERQWVRIRLEELDAPDLPPGEVDVELAIAAAWLDLGAPNRALERVRGGVRAALAAEHEDEWLLHTWARLMQPLLDPETPEGGEWALHLGRCLLAALDADLDMRESILVVRTWMSVIGATRPVELVRVARWLESYGPFNRYWATMTILESLAPADAGGDLAWRLLQDVMAPIAPYGGEEALAALARATPSEQLAPRLRELAARLAVEAAPTAREFWGRELAALSKPTRTKSSTLGKKITSGAELIARLKQEKSPGNERDEWIDALVRLAGTLTVEEVRALFLMFAGTFSGPRVGAILRERLRQLGEDAITADLAHEAYDATGHGDDGMRLASIAAFAFPVAREIFWTQLERDPTRGLLPFGTPSNVSANEIGHALDVLAASAEERREVARAIAGFVASLLSATMPSPGPDPPLDRAETARAALAAQLVNPLRECEAHDGVPARTSASLLAGGDRDIARQLVVDGDEHKRLRNLRIVDAALRQGSPPSPIRDYVATRAREDPSPLVRAVAQEVGTRLSLEHVGAHDAVVLAEARAALDPVCLMHEPVPRPPEIAPMAVGEDNDDLDLDAWRAASDGGCEPPTRVAELWVIAETMTLGYPIRRPALTERRTRVLGGENAKCWTDAVENAVGLSADDYADYPPDPEAAGRLVLEREEMPGGPRSRWLAFHPAVARELGWMPCDGLFAWCDSSGAAMVHSMWWKNGTPITQMGSEDEIGEGWLVLATDEAMRQLRELHPTLHPCASLARSTGDGPWSDGVTEEDDDVWDDENEDPWGDESDEL